eukprot:TRINITY_DN38845_c1_g1_i1.p1 TRINITY_DN38845_c1_g1~~TRINITY_DN38845_c1_g1_i1.p1  ORF type:complete len:448 (-),score=52.71 TRINITY_DN38845_c1_g1_i1:176-1468(-)
MESCNGNVANGFLSKRVEVAMKPQPSYIKAVFEALNNQWSPQNPEGYLLYAVAENKLSLQLIRDKLCEFGSDIPEWCLNYNSPVGLEQFREALVKYLKTTFMKGVDFLDASQLVLTNGCCSALDHLCVCLANQGEGVLIPAPYYPMFDLDVAAKAGLIPCPAHLDFDASNLIDQLDKSLQDYKSQNIKISILLLTNPNNPLGTVYTEDQLLTLIRWCCKNKIHLLSDEIYGNSVFDDAVDFKSAATITNQYKEDLEHWQELVHVAFGFSKDWCMSGLRIGCIWSQNQQLLQALGGLGYFAQIPNTVEYQMSKVLEDESFVEKFLKENKAALKRVYDRVTGYLKDLKIPYVKASGGMFVWADLRHLLPQNTWEGEDEIFTRLHTQLRVVFSPGKFCHAKEPGFFRICFAYVSEEALPVLFERLSKFVDGSL